MNDYEPYYKKWAKNPLPKWAENICNQSGSVNFEAGVRAVLERLEATKANDRSYPTDDGSVADIFNKGRASVRAEILGDE